jgi:DNA-binding transcriptional MerR regulator
MYSIKKVSQLLGIPAVTIRAWEKRYQIINPIRSNGGHRLYSDTDIETLKWIKQQIDEKDMKVSDAVSLLKQCNDELEKGKLEFYSLENPYEDILQRLYMDLVSLNTTEAHNVINLAFSMYHYNDVFHEILAPALYRIGDEWEKGNLTVAQEHFSTEIIMQRCSQFLRSLPIQPNLPKALAFCPEGEQHQMGLMLFSLFLRNKGLDLTYLGPNTPLKDLVDLIKLKNISLVAVSITNSLHIKAIEGWITLCHQESRHTKIVLGGKGFLHSISPLSSYVLSGDKTDWENWYQSTIIA